MNKKKVLLIIPAYNEEKNIVSVYNNIKCDKFDIIVINDGSTDGTAKVCEENNIPFINGILNLGIGGAVQTGYKYASKMGYDIAVQFDGDGQHKIEYLDVILEPIIKGETDFCIGSRFIDNNKDGFKSTASRRVGIKIISWLIKTCTGKRITDPTSGYRAGNKAIIELFAKSYPSEYPEPESITYLLKKGFCVKEVPVLMQERVEGKSSIHSWKNLYYMVNVCLSILLTSFTRKEG